MSINEGSILIFSCLVCSYIFYHIGFIRGSSWMQKVSEDNNIFKGVPPPPMTKPIYRSLKK
jgi:hypothetical protein